MTSTSPLTSAGIVLPELTHIPLDDEWSIPPVLALENAMPKSPIQPKTPLPEKTALPEAAPTEDVTSEATAAAKRRSLRKSNVPDITIPPPDIAPAVTSAFPLSAGFPWTSKFPWSAKFPTSAPFPASATFPTSATFPVSANIPLTPAPPVNEKTPLTPESPILSADLPRFGNPLVSEGKLTFIVQGETCHTWYKVFGDLYPASGARTRTPLVVVHGGPGMSHDYMLPLADLASSRPVIFYDQLGSGRSTHLPDKPRWFWTVALFIDELENLLSHFDIQDDFDLVGHSWGACLATELEVRRQPVGLRHLVLTNPLAETKLYTQSNDELALAFPKAVQRGLASGYSDPKKCRAALEKFHAVHGCTVKPMPAEVIFSTIDQLFGENSDPTVSIAM